MGGLILQWGTASNSNNLGTGYSSTNFPIAFPTSCLFVSPTAATSSSSSYAAFFVNYEVGSATATKFNWMARNQAGTAAATGTQQMNFISVGY